MLRFTALGRGSAPVTLMAVSFAEVLQTGQPAGVDTKVWDVIASADADTTATIPHGMGAAPNEVYLTWLHLVASVALWRVTTLDATNIVLTKSTTASSSTAGAQVRVIAKRPTHIGR